MASSSSSNSRAGTACPDEDLQYDASQSIVPAHTNHHCKVPNCKNPNNHLVPYDTKPSAPSSAGPTRTRRQTSTGPSAPRAAGRAGWLQVELALWLQRQPNTALVLREQHVYTNPAHAMDILVLTKDGTRNVIELKCESLNQDCQLSTKDGAGVPKEERDGSPLPKKTHRVSGVKGGANIPSFAKRVEED